MKLLSVLMLLLSSFIANASLISIDIENASFEQANPFNYVHPNRNGTGVDAQYNRSVIGWTGFGWGTMDSVDFMYTAVDGNNNVWSNGGYIEQILTSALNAGTYTFSLWFGERDDTQGLPTSSAQLFAGNVLIGEIIATANDVNDGWAFFSASFDVSEDNAALGESLRIRINSGGTQVLVDDVRLSLTQVPEPSALFLLSLGLLGLGARRVHK
ncbi:PEP-CTERM sorting domain-containing protein [Aestuariibacter salexigens]|uniref:PEP-CTERM sorting domain-containing protein n=1 Tax=Aestuariibacter salexigens TaxID=226010 RepID=UPI00047ECD57|nr:PEP-CTERM sorting domain-containing protein [Aestuariibacter salexigens]